MLTLDPRRWRVSTKLLVGIVCASVLPLAVFTLLNARAARVEIARAVSDEFHRLATIESEQLASVLVEQLTLLESLALDNAIETDVARSNASAETLEKGRAEEAIQQHDRQWASLPASDPWLRSILDPTQNTTSRRLARYVQSFPDHVEVFVTDERGALVGATGKTTDYDQADEIWWQACKSAGAPFIGQPLYDESTGTVALNLAVPIRQEQSGEVVGVLRSTYRVSALKRIVARSRFGRTGHITILDASGRVVASSDDMPLGSRPPQSWARAIDARSVGSYDGLKSPEGAPLAAGLGRVSVANGVVPTHMRSLDRLDWLVIVHQYESEAFGAVRASVRRGVAVGLFFALVAGLFALAVARYGLAPIQRLARLSRQMAAGDLSVRMPIEHQDNLDDLGELSRDFNAMADEIAATVGSLEARVKARTVELEAARVAAESATLAKSSFLASMSHELRTPLNSIIGFSELLHDQAFGPLNPKQLKYVTNVLVSGRHLLQLVNDILDISKIEAGKMTLELGELRIETLLDASVNLLRQKALSEGVTLTARATDALQDRTIVADARKLKQVLFNLIANAVKATPSGGKIEVLAALQPTAELARAAIDAGLADSGVEEWLAVAVADTGIGVAPKDQERIFHEFEQAGPSTVQGTGLGLSLCRKLIGLHRGAIWVESAGTGKGSTFTFVVPLRPALSTELATLVPGPSAVAETERQEDESRPLILVVDDDPGSNELVSVYLAEARYRVTQAYNGVQALERARQRHPDLITLDISLPGKDGWEVLAELKSSDALRGIPVVIVSVVDKRPFGLNLGAVDYFIKPVEKQLLLESVARALDAPSSRSPLVLVADDDATMVTLLTTYFEAAGYKVLQAHGGRECIELAREHHPDIILLDLLMPEVSGFDVVRDLQGCPKAGDIPVIVFTGKELSASERAQLDSHVTEIMKKDCGVREDLVATVGRALRRAPRLPGAPVR